MSILPYQIVKHLCQVNMMVQPYAPKTKIFGFTFGISESGYDIRIAQDLTLYPVTLKNLLLKTFGIARPSFALASSIEKFRIPNDIMAFVLDKSTWARQGLALQNTCLEPCWSGFLTLELTNHSDKIIKLKKGMPIAQVVFHYLYAPTEMPYVGKYQHQVDKPQPAILED